MPQAGLPVTVCFLKVLTCYPHWRCTPQGSGLNSPPQNHPSIPFCHHTDTQAPNGEDQRRCGDAQPPGLGVDQGRRCQLELPVPSLIPPEHWEQDITSTGAHGDRDECPSLLVPPAEGFAHQDVRTAHSFMSKANNPSKQVSASPSQLMSYPHVTNRISRTSPVPCCSFLDGEGKPLVT